MSVNLQLTGAELEALHGLLCEEGQRMDDDGREGAFDKSIFKPIYKKVRLLRAYTTEPRKG